MAHSTGCATEIFQWRISLVCATEINAPQKQKYMRHRIIYRYSEIAAACCINTGILQEIQVYIQDLYRYNRNNNIFDTVYENRHITMSSHYLEPEIHKYSDKCRIFTQVMIQKFIDHVTRYKMKCSPPTLGSNRVHRR
jgi:hypothetical protein